MKHTYITPELNLIKLNTTMLCLSQGSNEGDGVAEAKKFWGNSLWEEDDNPEEDDLANGTSSFQ